MSDADLLDFLEVAGRRETEGWVTVREGSQRDRRNKYRKTFILAGIAQLKRLMEVEEIEVRTVTVSAWGFNPGLTVIQARHRANT